MSAASLVLAWGRLQGVGRAGGMGRRWICGRVIQRVSACCAAASGRGWLVHCSGLPSRASVEDGGMHKRKEGWRDAHRIASLRSGRLPEAAPTMRRTAGPHNGGLSGSGRPAAAAAPDAATLSLASPEGVRPFSRTIAAGTQRSLASVGNGALMRRHAWNGKGKASDGSSSARDSAPMGAAGVVGARSRVHPCLVAVRGLRTPPKWRGVRRTGRTSGDRGSCPSGRVAQVCWPPRRGCQCGNSNRACTLVPWRAGPAAPPARPLGQVRDACSDWHSWPSFSLEEPSCASTCVPWPSGQSTKALPKLADGHAVPFPCKQEPSCVHARASSGRSTSIQGPRRWRAFFHGPWASPLWHSASELIGTRCHYFAYEVPVLRHGTLGPWGRSEYV